MSGNAPDSGATDKLRPALHRKRDGNRRVYGVGLMAGATWAGLATVSWGWVGRRPEGCARNLHIDLNWWGRNGA